MPSGQGLYFESNSCQGAAVLLNGLMYCLSDPRLFLGMRCTPSNLDGVPYLIVRHTTCITRYALQNRVSEPYTVSSGHTVHSHDEALTRAFT